MNSSISANASTFCRRHLESYFVVFNGVALQTVLGATPDFARAHVRQRITSLEGRYRTQGIELLLSTPWSDHEMLTRRGKEAIARLMHEIGGTVLERVPLRTVVWRTIAPTSPARIYDEAFFAGRLLAFLDGSVPLDEREVLLLERRKGAQRTTWVLSNPDGEPVLDLVRWNHPARVLF